MTTPIRVLVADDHPAIRAGVKVLLNLSEQINVVGEAETTQQAVERARELAPDVVLMDMRIPDDGGIEATRTLLRDRPDLAVLILTMVRDDDAVFAALRAGARGFLLKEAGHEELCRAVIAVSKGELITSAAVARQVSQFFAGADSKAEPTPFPSLTVRERELLQLMASGLNNASIARRLVLSPKTVRNHISSIFAKMQVSERAEAIVRAREAGLGSRSDTRP